MPKTTPPSRLKPNLAWALVTAPLLLLAPALRPDRALFWGTPALQFYPWRDYGLTLLRQGVPPLWNPLLGAGAPLAANYQSAFFYPLTWPVLVLGWLGGRPALIWAHALSAALHLVLAAWGMRRLAQSLGAAEPGATVAGLAYGLSGYLVARLGFFSINATAAWVPWVLWGVAQVARQPTLRRAAQLGLLWGLQGLAGHAQTAWYTALLAGLWALYLLIRTPRGRARLLLAWGLAALSAAALAAVQLVPTAEYLAQSQRAAGVDPELGLAYSFWPWHGLSLLAPEAFGNPAYGDYWGYANYWEDALYVGWVPLLGAVLALGGLFRAPKAGGAGSPRGMAVFWGGVVALGFVLALGKHSPAFRFLWQHMPTFDLFQAPARWLLWVEVGLALLAGWGLSRWRRPGPRGLYWVRLGTAGAAGAVAVASALAWAAPESVRAPSLLRGVALAGVWACGVGLLTLTAPPSGQRPNLRWQAALVAWTALDLLVAGWGLNPTVPMRWLTAPSPRAQAVAQQVGAGRLFLNPTDEERLKFRRYFRFDTFWPPQGWADLTASLLPNLTLWAQVPSANNFDPLVPGRYADWWLAWEDASAVVQQRMLARMGVTVVQRVGAAPAYANTFRPLPGAEPIARWVPGAVPVAEGASALQSVLWRAALGGAPWRQAIAVEWPSATPPPGPLWSPDLALAEAEVRLVSAAPLQRAYRVRSAAPGWLFVAETWYPGWRAWVDGRSVPLLRAEYLFRAVPLPAGAHEVTLRYAPWWWPGVAWFSLGVAVLLLGLALGREGMLGGR